MWDSIRICASRWEEDRRMELGWFVVGIRISERHFFLATQVGIFHIYIVYIYIYISNITHLLSGHPQIVASNAIHTWLWGDNFSGNCGSLAIVWSFMSGEVVWMSPFLREFIFRHVDIVGFGLIYGHFSSSSTGGYHIIPPSGGRS